MKKFSWALCAAGLLVGGVQLIQAAAPAKVSEVLAIDDMVAEAKEKVAKLKESVASDEAFKKAIEEKSLGQDAGVLAVVAQAIAEHDKGKDSGIAAPTLRNAAVGLRRMKELAPAKEAVAKAEAALAGKADADAMVDHPWNKLTGMHGMMEEINGRGSKLRRALQRPKDLKKDSQHASVIVALALAMEEDTHEVKNADDIPQWKAWSKEYRDSLGQVAVAMKAGDAKKAQEVFNNSGKVCGTCHEKFRDKK